MAKKDGVIYLITNKINGKKYVGQTIQNPKRRFRRHKYNYDNTAIGNAFDKYGEENFELEILEECESDNLNDREKYWINYYNAYEEGYNLSIGGKVLREKQNPATITNIEIAKKIIKLRKGGLKQKEIGEKINLSQIVVGRIIRGEHWTSKYLDCNFDKLDPYIGFQKSNNANSKITIKDTIDIINDKNAGFSIDDLKNKYQISRVPIYSILHNEHWTIKEINKRREEMNLLEQDIKKSIKEQNLWGIKLRDMTFYKGSQSPFDFIIWNGNKLLGLECKLLKERKNSNPKSIPFKRVPQHQRNGLSKINEYDNSEGYILVNFRWIDHKKGKCFAVEIGEFLQLEQALDRKSIPLSYFDECGLELERLGKGWDLRLLL